MKSLLMGVLLSLLTVTAQAEEKSKPPEIGDRAPALELEKLLQAPDGAQLTWDALKGKVVVLEFWATWCGPCVGAIPHLNELVDASKDKPIVFLCITDEDEKTVKDFLDKKPMHGWIGLNTSRSTIEAFGIHGIPHTVIVGPDGKIAANTFPYAVESKHLDNILAGKESDLPLMKPGAAILAAQAGDTLPAATHEDNAESPIFQILIRPSKAEKHARNGGANSRDKNQFGVIFNDLEEGATVDELLSSLYGVTPAHLVIDAPMPEGKFDVIVKGPYSSQAQINDVRREAVEATFGLSAKRETRDVEGYVLKANNLTSEGLRPTRTPNAASSRSGLGKYQCLNVKIASLVGRLETLLKKPVADETGLQGNFDIDLKWDQPDKDTPNETALVEAVQKQLGLELASKKQPVEVTVINREEKTKRSMGAFKSN